MDRFCHFRYVNNDNNMPDMTGAFASGTNASLVAKNGTKQIILLLSMKSSPVDRFQSLRCLNDRIDLAYMIRSLASGTNASLVAKNGTKKNFSNVAIFDHNFALFRGRNRL